MTATWLLTIIAVILIFIEKKTEPLKISSIKTNAHGLVGLIASILAFIQPFMAFFRPGPNSSKRKIFNYSHLSVGKAAMILSVTAIILITQLKSVKLDHDSALYVAIAFAAFYVSFHIILTLISYIVKEKTVKNKIVSGLLVVSALFGTLLAVILMFYIVKGEKV